VASRANVRVIVLHREHLIAEALQVALTSQRGLLAPAATSDPGAVLALAQEHAPDVAVVDLELAREGGVDMIRRMTEASPATAVLALSGGDDFAVARAVEAGAAGHVPKSAPIQALAESIRKVASGDTLVGADERRHLLRRLRHRRAEEASAEQRARRLTRRELEILQLMADGVPAERLAVLLGMSPATLRTHIQNIITKLGVHSKTEALAFAIRHGRISAHT
jgi:two-component system, NarL family, nitrate/nitrite response regulator NarL